MIPDEQQLALTAASCYKLPSGTVLMCTAFGDFMYGGMNEDKQVILVNIINARPILKRESPHQSWWIERAMIGDMFDGRFVVQWNSDSSRVKARMKWGMNK